jgi:hypothetical protein
MKQVLFDTLFYLIACIISGIVTILILIGFPIMILDWFISAQIMNAEAFLTFNVKNHFKAIFEIFFGRGFIGALYVFFVGIPLVYIVHRKRK